MRHLLGFSFILAVTACYHSGALHPAVLSDGSDTNISALKAHLTDEMGSVNINIGASDPTESFRFSVLPPPLGEHETRSPASPTQFELFVHNGACFARREDTETLIPLDGVSCREAN